MAIDAIGAVAAQGVGPAGGSGARPVDLTPAGVSPSSAPTDVRAEVRFNDAMARVGGLDATGSPGSVPPAMKGMFDALDQVNVQARSVADYAQSAEASGGQLTPGEIVQLTMKCQEFMFQAQLTSNIANRSSDGVQQMFKQQ